MKYIFILLSTILLCVTAKECWHKNKAPEGYNNTLIGCILFRNEGRYLKEWLVYHQLGGFDHMYMYNHQSKDNSLEVLKPFVDMGFVTVINWDDKPGHVQTNQIRHCHNNYGMQSMWTALFDVDEFFVSMYDPPTETGFVVYPLMQWFKHQAGVELFRANFDSNGHTSPPSGLVMDQYTSRWTDENLAGKVITQYRHIESLAGHTAKPKPGHKVVDTRLWDVWGDRGRHYTNGPLRINHYITRSFDECSAKKNQTAFPGSWRAQSDEYCNNAMLGSKSYYPWQHYRDDWLSRKWGKTVQECMDQMPSK